MCGGEKKVKGADMAECKFNIAWIGDCGKECEGDFCEKHSKLKCCSCGAQATRECDATVGPLVCGCHICPDCEHELDEEGTNGWNCQHCKKGEQKYTPWYIRKLEEVKQ
jgi:hypothetical protein